MATKEFSEKIHNLWTMIKSFIRLKYDGLRLSFAIYMADALQKARNKRFYVLDNGKGQLIWLCNDDIKIMRRPRLVRKMVFNPKTQKHELKKWKVSLIPPKTTHSDVMRDCYYYTPASRNNEGAITVEERNSKRKAWLEYMEQYRMNRMLGRRKVKFQKK